LNKWKKKLHSIRVAYLYYRANRPKITKKKQKKANLAHGRDDGSKGCEGARRKMSSQASEATSIYVS
jgi:hypothetical protein